MPCSEKKRQANRANSLKSTGPKSKEGKAKVALNGLKHGLRSDQVVLPTEDANAFDAMLATWMDDWQPPTDARRVLVEQAVAHAWRLRRCLKLERDYLVNVGRCAVREAEQAAAARTRASVELLPTDPAAALTALCSEREGVVGLIGLWSDLAGAAASSERWHDVDGHHCRLLNLLGYTRDTDADDLGGPVLASWRLLEWNEPEPTEFADDAPADQPEADALTVELSTFIAGQLTALKSYHDTRFASPEQHAARLAHEAALDDSPRGRALLRYEGQHGREFRATLNQLIKLTQTDADVVIDDEPQVVVETPVEVLASPSPTKATEAVAPSPTKATEVVVEAVEAPTKATEEDVAPDNRVADAVTRYLERVKASRSDR